MDRIAMSSVTTATDATILAVLRRDLSIGAGRELAVAANLVGKALRGLVRGVVWQAARDFRVLPSAMRRLAVGSTW